jgi:WD40 repeat protein
MRGAIQLLTVAAFAAVVQIPVARAEDYCDKMRSDIEKARCQTSKSNRVPPEDLARAEAGATHVSWVYDAVLSPDGTLLASAGKDQVVKLWDVASGKFIRNLGKHDGWVRAVIFSPDGKTVYSLADNQGLSELDVATGKLGRTQPSPPHEWYYLSISRDGKLIAIRGDKNTILWRTGEWSELSRLSYTSRVHAAEFSPNSATLLQVDSRSAQLWDSETGKSTTLLPVKEVDTAAYSPDGSLIGWAGGGKAGVWDVASEKPLRDWPINYQFGVFAVAVTPDKAVLLTGTSFPSAWNIATGKLLQKFGTMEDLTHSIAITPDGRFAITTHMGSDIRMWDITTGELVRQFGQRVNEP